jgi:predicted permease
MQHALDTFWTDVVFAARLLRKSPTFTVAAVLTLALGIGVNAALFSVVNAILLRPLPVREGDRLVVIATGTTSSRALTGVSFADLRDYQDVAADVFEDIAGYSVGFAGLALGHGRPERVLVTSVTGNYFQLLDLRPAAGRLLHPQDGESNQAVVVLGHSTWQRRFGADLGSVGRTVRVNGRPHTILGIAPPGFAGTFAFSESELYVPGNWESVAGSDRRARSLHAIARLRPGVGIESAQARMDVAGGELARRYPESNRNVTVTVLPERLARPEEDQYRTNAFAASMMMTLVGLVTIVAAVNVTNLQLSRVINRRQELAVRAVLGAGRGRLVRQLVTESLVLSTVGGTVGALLGTWAARALARIPLPGDLPVHFEFDWDARVLAYIATIVLVTGLLVGIVPALRVSGMRLDETLRESRHGSRGPSGARARGVLVALQIAASVVLLTLAGLFGRSLDKAGRADLGFQPEGVLNVQVDVDQVGYAQDRGQAFFDEIHRRVRSLTGVQHVSFSFTIPMGYVRVKDALEAEGQPDLGERVSAGRNSVSPEYFQTMGIELVRGRSFRETDDEQSRRVAVVNQRLAHTLWPGRDPIGRRLRRHGSDEPWIEVVGVTRTGKYESLFEEPQGYYFVPVAQAYTGLRVLQIRTSLPPGTLAPAVEQIIHEVEPDLPIFDVQSMSQALGSGPGLFPVRVGAASVTTLSLLAFVLASVGLYGLVSSLAAQRTHEIGVRMAVGATAANIVRLVAGHGVAFVTVGLAIGMVVVLASAGIVEGLLFGISPRDPLVLGSVSLILGAVAVIACTVPAWRAARVDPMVALRCE